MSGYLKGKSVYLCGPIKMVFDDGQEWRDAITPRLNAMDIRVINPCKNTSKDFSEIGEDKKIFADLILKEKWGKLKERFWPVVRHDLRSVDLSDFIIFNYDPDVPTIGSVHELVVSTFEKKIILLKYDKAKLKNFNPWMCVFIKKHHFFSSWDTMFTYLKKVDRGEFDTSLWVI